MAHRVAEAFDAAPRSSTAAPVAAAYAALGDQARRFFRFVTGDESGRPILVAWTAPPEPYASADEVSESVRLDRVLELCPTQRDVDHPRAGGPQGDPPRSETPCRFTTCTPRPHARRRRDTCAWGQQPALTYSVESFLQSDTRRPGWSVGAQS
jgi:hypothetical protein